MQLVLDIYQVDTLLYVAKLQTFTSIQVHIPVYPRKKNKFLSRF